MRGVVAKRASQFYSKAEIPTDHLSLYTERDGAWVLEVDGAVEKARLDEFRNTNVALIKERDELKQRFAGIDPDEVKALAEEKRRLEEAQALKAGEVEKVVENRIKGIKADLDKQVSTLSAEREALTARLTAIQIDQGVITVATKRGLRPTALTDITARARSVFRLVNGVPTAFEADSKTVRYGKDGLTPMTWGASATCASVHSSICSKHHAFTRDPIEVGRLCHMYPVCSFSRSGLHIAVRDVAPPRNKPRAHCGALDGQARVEM